MVKSKDFLINFSKLTRPLSNTKNIVIIAIAFYFANVEFHLLPILLGFFALSFVSSAIYGYNAVNDLNLDINNGNKKYYAEGVQFFGERKSLIIVSVLAVIGLVLGFYLGYYVFFALVALLITGFLYSSKYTRFKEKIAFDVLFGASLTFLFRFIASWYIFSNSAPSLLPILALVFGKTAGYPLYKGMDREYLLSQHITNTITSISLKALFIFSFFFATLTAFSVVLMFLNPLYFHINILGSVPFQVLFLIPFAIPPAVVICLQIVKKTKFKNPSLRFWGYIYMFLVTVIGYWIIK